MLYLVDGNGKRIRTTTRRLNLNKYFGDRHHPREISDYDTTTPSPMETVHRLIKSIPGGMEKVVAAQMEMMEKDRGTKK